MKIKCNTKVLAKALSVTSRGVSGRSSVALLSAILFEAQDGAKGVKTSATDTEMTVSFGWGPVEVEEGGSCAIPAKLLSEIVKTLPQGEEDRVELATDDAGGSVVLKSGENAYTIRVYPPNDFPKMPGFPQGDEGSFELPVAAFSDAVAKVLPAASKDDTRPVLTGVLISFEGGRARMVTTDSYRLAIGETVLEGAPEEKKALIPARGLAELGKITAELPIEKVKVALTENAALFKAGTLLVSTRLIDGNFPDYGRLLPKGLAKEFSVSSAELIDTLKRVNLFASRASQSPPIPLKLVFKGGSLEGGTLQVSAERPELGGAKETIPASASEDLPEDGFAIAFNGGYLQEGARAIGTEKLVMAFNEPSKPGVLRAGGDQNGDGDPDGGGSFSYVIMPMRDPGANK